MGMEGDDDQIPDCNAAVDFPQPVPSEPWSRQRITSACTGDVRLCVSLKHGDAENPTDSDCEIMEYCFDAAYESAGKTLELPDLPGWSATDADCSNKFFEKGYVEFRGDGELGCNNVPRINRVQICPAKCATEAEKDSKECKKCGTARLRSSF